MDIGPFHITMEVPIGTIFTIALGTAGVLWKIQGTARRISRIYEAFYNPQLGTLGPECFFKQWQQTKEKVDEMWERLRFDRLRAAADRRQEP